MALSLLQKAQYSSFESLLIGVKQSWQYFMILGVSVIILKSSEFMTMKKM